MTTTADNSNMSSCLEREELIELFEIICNDINLNEEAKEKAWKSYCTISCLYSLDGEKSDWLVCAIYSACQTSSVSCVSDISTKISGNGISLTRLLSSANVEVSSFFDKLKRWLDMQGSPLYDLSDFIIQLERNFNVGKIMFGKFQRLFANIFCYEGAAVTKPTNDNKKNCSAPLSILTHKRLFDFCWTFYSFIRARYLKCSDNLVHCFNVLICCLDFAHSNVLNGPRSDLLTNESKDLEDVISFLCKRYNALEMSTRSIKLYEWQTVMNNLINENCLILSDERSFTTAFSADNFDKNEKNLNKAYEELVLEKGVIDERLFIGRNSKIDIAPAAFSKKLYKGSVADVNKEGIRKSLNFDQEAEERHADAINVNSSSIFTTRGSTPLSASQYFKGVEENAEMTPISSVTQTLFMLQSLIKYSDEIVKSLIEENGGDTVFLGIQQRLDNVKDLFTHELISTKENNTDVKLHFNFIQSLYFHMLKRILNTEKESILHRTGGTSSFMDLESLLKHDNFNLSLLALCIEIVMLTTQFTSAKTYPWVLKLLNLPAYIFFRCIELFIRAEPKLPRDVVRHLNRIEEKILESDAWLAASPLWITVSKNKLLACNQVFCPQYLENNGVGSAISLHPSNSDYTSSHLYTISKALTHSPSLRTFRRFNSLSFFLRKFYYLSSLRLRDLSSKLQLNRLVSQCIWACFEYVILNHNHLMKDRHVDQIMMSCIYSVSKLTHQTAISFSDIMKSYRSQPNAHSSVYRDVLIEDECRGDIIHFYNKIFVSIVKDFLANCEHPSGTIFTSPLPILSPLLATRRQVSSRYPVYVSPLKKQEHHLSRSPTSNVIEFTYTFSPSKDINRLYSPLNQISVPASRPFTTSLLAPKSKRLKLDFSSK